MVTPFSTWKNNSQKNICLLRWLNKMLGGVEMGLLTLHLNFHLLEQNIYTHCIRSTFWLSLGFALCFDVFHVLWKAFGLSLCGNMQMSLPCRKQQRLSKREMNACLSSRFKKKKKKSCLHNQQIQTCKSHRTDSPACWWRSLTWRFWARST